MGITKEQQDFLDANGKIVLCACPGSGKTTIVARKFLKYQEEWDKAHSGIAVLSFTNVACDSFLAFAYCCGDSYCSELGSIRECLQ